MPRPPKPWFRKDRNAWYVTINGKRIRLASDRENAHRRFHEIMAELPLIDSDENLVEIIQEFVLWTKKNRRQGTYEFYRQHAQHFIAYLKRKKMLTMDCSDLNPAKFEAYLDGVSDGRRNGAVTSIKRVFNWAVKRGRIKHNPITALEKPSLGRRKNIISDSVFAKMLKLALPDFKSLITFAWETGCRPQEVCRLEPRHIQPEHFRCVIPLDETKRRKEDRIIYCNKKAWSVLNQHLQTGFRRRSGEPWDKNACNHRLHRMKEELGRKYAMYDIRHTYITNMVRAGESPHTIAKLVGTSVLMIEKFYDHSIQDVDHMLAIVNKKPR